MPIEKVYQRKQKGEGFGSSMEKKEPNIKNVYAPETPVRTPPLAARPQLLCVRRRSEISGEQFRDPIFAICAISFSFCSFLIFNCVSLYKTWS